MKKLLFLLLLIPALCQGQTYTTITRLENTFTVDDKTYQLGALDFVLYPDTTIIQFNRGGTFVVPGKKYYMYINGATGDTFASKAALLTYYNDSMSVLPAGSGTVTTVSSGNLSPLFTTSVSNATTTPAISYTLSNAAAYTVLTNSTNATAAPAYAKVDPLALKNNGGTASSSTYYRGDGVWATPAGGGGWGDDTLTVELSASQLNNCFTSPITLIPAQGAGIYIIPRCIIFQYTYGTSPYGGGSSSLLLKTTAATWNTLANVLNSGTSITYQLIHGATNASSKVAIAANSDFVLTAQSSDPSGGDGTVKMLIIYDTWDSN